MRRATTLSLPVQAAQLYFNPHPPCGGRQFGRSRELWSDKFQSTPSMRRATTECALIVSGIDISIHTLHAEGDFYIEDKIFYSDNISIHTLHAEGDIIPAKIGGYIFHFNPHPPCGGRPCGKPIFAEEEHISIHTIHAEGDCQEWWKN